MDEGAWLTPVRPHMSAPSTSSALRVLAGLCLGVLAATCAGTARADEVVLLADAWCPYNCEPGSDTPGFMIEIARELLRHRARGDDSPADRCGFLR